jgi:hypothetical protein
MSELLAPPRSPKVASLPASVDVRSAAGLAETAHIVTAATPGNLDQHLLIAPPGRFFAGTSVDVRVFPAIDDGRILTAVPHGYASDPFLRRSRRGLVVAASAESDATRFFGMDTRQVRRRLMSGRSNCRLVVPRAYLLDDLSLGILWAVANLDEALLHDDALLASAQAELSHFETLSRSAASRDIASDLNPAAAMWLGSDFCARHILRNLESAREVPAFWTREQRGEEASTWLLFDHKYEYLDRLAKVVPASMTRTFCVPHDTVQSSPPAERMLLLLAAALMESFGIQIQVTPEPEYAAVDGFVLEPGNRAIVANWVGADGIWNVDITTSRSILREYADAAGHAQAHNAADGDSPEGRLRSFADYLGLSWTTLSSRCAAISEYGLGGLAQPHSRLLSLRGADRACGFLGSFAAHTGR